MHSNGWSWHDEEVGKLLSIAEYAALGECEAGYTELCGGVVSLWPNPTVGHNVAMGELGYQLHRQLPDRLLVIHGIDVDLELVPAGGPGFSRRPDLVVVDADALDRVEVEGGLIRASEVRVVIEIVSPESHRRDNVLKREEYARAGIPHYWLVDLGEPVSVVGCHLAGEFGYRDSGAVTGEFTTTSPCPITLRVDQLS